MSFSGDMDYHSVQSSISFPAFTIEGMFNISLQDNNILEFSENFSISIRLEIPSLRVNIPNDTAVVVIQDDDRKFWCAVMAIMYTHHVLAAITLNFSQSTYYVNENTETVQLTLHFSNPSSFDIMIRVIPMDINATSELDYCLPNTVEYAMVTTCLNKKVIFTNKNKPTNNFQVKNFAMK